MNSLIGHGAVPCSVEQFVMVALFPLGGIGTVYLFRAYAAPLWVRVARRIRGGVA